MNRFTSPTRAILIVVLFMATACSDPEQDPEPTTSVEDMTSADLPEEDMPEEDMPEEMAPDEPACSEERCPGGTIENLPNYMWLDPGQKFTLEPWLISPTGERIEDVTFTFETEDVFTASINDEGIVRGESDGEVLITARAGGVEGTTPFAVSVVSPGINTQLSYRGEVGDEQKISVKWLEYDFMTEVDLDIICTSMDDSIVVIDDKYDCLATYVGVGDTEVMIEHRFLSGGGATVTITVE